MRNAVIYVMRRPGVHSGRIGITVSSRGQSAACDWPDSLALNPFLPDYESRGLQAPTGGPRDRRCTSLFAFALAHDCLLHPRARGRRLASHPLRFWRFCPFLS